MAINISRDTCMKELYDVEGVDEDLYKLQNINLVFGKVNAIEYCSNMFKFPTLQDISKVYESSCNKE